MSMCLFDEPIKMNCRDFFKKNIHVSSCGVTMAIYIYIYISVCVFVVCFIDESMTMNGTLGAFTTVKELVLHSLDFIDDE